MLDQARATEFGIGGLRVRDPRRRRASLLDQAGGIVIALLVAFSLVALVAAGDDARRRRPRRRAAPAADDRRAAGARVLARGRSPARHAREAALVAAAGGRCSGWRSGALAVAGPARRAARGAQRARRPARALLAPLAGLPGSPSWRSSPAAARGRRGAPRGRPPAALLRGAELAAARPRARAPAAGSLGLGARLALAAPRARRRASASSPCARGVVLLMLALASLLVGAARRPGLAWASATSSPSRCPPTAPPTVRAIPGVAAAAPRYQVDAADSFALGEPVRVVAYPGDHTRFEAPPLDRRPAVARPRRGRGRRSGWPRRSACAPGATLAVQLAGGGEARFRVVGMVRALDNDGRVAYVRAAAAARRGPAPASVDRRAARAGRRPRRGRARALAALGAPPPTARRRRRARNARASSATLAGRAAGGRAASIGLVCLYALVQALALTARERRGDDRAAARASAPGAATVARGARGRGARGRAARPRSSGVALERLVLGPAGGAARRGLRRRCRSAPAPAQALLVAGGLLAAGGGGGRACGRPARRCASRSRRAARGVTRAAHRAAVGARCRRAGRRGRAAGRAAAARGPPAPGGSTLARDAARPDGDGVLSPAPGEPLRDRTDLGPARARRARRWPRFAPDHRRPRPRRGVAGARRRSSTASAARSPPPSARRRRSPRRCWPPPCASVDALRARTRSSRPAT